MIASHNYAYQSYTTTKAVTAVDPLELILMLYDGAIDFLGRATRAMESGDRAVKLRYLERALAILEELERSLNLEAGGQVSENLQRLYLYMMKELTLANAENNPRRLAGIIQLLADMRPMFEPYPPPAKNGKSLEIGTVT